MTEASASPTLQYLESGTAFDQPLVAFRLAATGGNVDVNAITLTLAGTGSFTADVTGLEAWLDDGDGSFNATLDQSLWSGPGAASSVQMTLGSPLTVTTGASEDIWVVASFAATAGSSLGKSYQMSIASAADVAVDAGSTASLGTPAPQSTSISLIEYSVTSLDVSCAEDRLTLYGSGLTPPVEMYVGGQLIAATATVNASHTEVTFDYVTPNPVPAGQTLEINTSSLGLKSTGFAFMFNVPCSSSRASDGSGCSTEDSPSWLLILTLSLLASAGLVRVLYSRRKRTG